MPNYIFPKLADDTQFEYMVRDIHKCLYPDAEVDKYGRNGQKQHGVDITIQTPQWLWCIQCKNQNVLTTSDVDAILEKCTFQNIHPFQKFIIATYACSDTHVVDHLIKIRGNAQYPFEIEYLHWELICGYIEQHPSILKQYYGPLLQKDPLKDECIKALIKYRVEEFLRIDPLVDGICWNWPERLEDCSYILQTILDKNLSRKGEPLYNLVEDLRQCIDEYNGDLGIILFSHPGEIHKFVYLPPMSGVDTQYQQKQKKVYQYRTRLASLIDAIARWSNP